MKYVYLLRSIADPDKRYIGVTADFQERLNEHNARYSPHTSRLSPMVA